MVNPFGCTKQFRDLQLPVSYCVSLIMVTITRHGFINILQMENISAVQFDMVYEKNMSFLMRPKSPKVCKKVEKIGLGSFKCLSIYTICPLVNLNHLESLKILGNFMSAPRKIYYQTL